jgi:hypothetical protein
MPSLTMACSSVDRSLPSKMLCSSICGLSAVRGVCLANCEGCRLPRELASELLAVELLPTLRFRPSSGW